MKITFVQPCVGKKPDGRYHRTWLMEPLSISTLSALTPRHVERVFHDDRLEPIPYDDATDLVAITVETYTARRAYRIAAEFRSRGVPVVLGGYHPTLLPEEASHHADAVIVGEAEGVWATLLADLERGSLQSLYRADPQPSVPGRQPDRSIYADKPYSRLGLVETGRGCVHGCEFCSITRFFNRQYRARPIQDVLDDVASLPTRNVFFVDDNFTVDRERAKELLRYLIPLRIRWVGQASIDVARDEELLRVLRASGCQGILVGFESLEDQTLAAMGKAVNRREGDYDEAISALNRHGLAIYATFVFGYGSDTRAALEQAYEFSLRHGFFFAAFNHLVPFPGTPLYDRLQREGRLLDDPWWLSPDYQFGDVAFVPEDVSPDELRDLCYEYRRRFYSLGSVLRRARNLRANCGGLRKALMYLLLSASGGSAARWRQGLPLG